ncbi:nucleoside triphosphate pyrophosphohydrolase ham1 [Lambiella insularis]|nr:nucleoside triphosphate pyrophosphohydrolase ham1 [Lambiella insularis]
MAPRDLRFITGNKNKLLEVQAILGGTVNLTSQSLELIEIQGTIEDIVTDKCKRAAAAINGPVIVEDTCLCFNALKGLPGPYIKWFFDAIGLEGLNNLLSAYEDKSAQAVCTFAYCEGPGHEPIIFEGRTNVDLLLVSAKKPALTTYRQGKIVPARGPTQFGFDPIFEYEGTTYAEMDKTEKNKISHRFKALDKLQLWLSSRP